MKKIMIGLLMTFAINSFAGSVTIQDMIVRSFNTDVEVSEVQTLLKTKCDEFSGRLSNIKCLKKKHEANFTPSYTATAVSCFAACNF